MQQFKLLGVALSATLLVAACGGSDDGVPVAPAPPKFTAMVSFGDSLSDVGTYKVGAVAALGGGLYTVNGLTGDIPSKNWTELVATQIGVAAPCPAQTGLDGDATRSFSVPVTNNASCFNYAQGGSRVTNPVGPGNKLLGGGNATLGQLTVPVVTQISNHLSRVGDRFSGKELVTVMAGANDIFRLSDTLAVSATAAGTAAGGAAFAQSLVSQLATGATDPTAASAAIAAAIGTLPAGSDVATVIVPTAVSTAAMQAGNAAVASPEVYGPMVATAQAVAATAGAAAGAAYAQANGASQAVLPMAEAGQQLGAYIKSQIVDKGAKYVAVVNLPDASATPSALSQNAGTQGLILTMVTAFNDALTSELQGVPGVQVVDLFTQTRNFAAQPATFGLTNVTQPACNLTAPSPNALGSSLVCNVNNLIPGDVSRYLYADTVHPTPYGYKLFADVFIANLKRVAWF